MTGRLVLVGTPIGNLADLTPRAVEALRDADLIAAEDTRRTRGLLSHAGVPAGRRLIAVHEHNERARADELVDAIKSGATVAVVTDAGMPAISDPGARLVRTCLDAGLAVEVVPGPTAALTALVVSGLPTDRFAFEGFLPGKATARRARLAELAQEPRTTVLFESPHRLADTLVELLDAVGPTRPLVLARELTKLHEEVVRGTVASALDQIREQPPRGEYVLVLGGAEPVEPSDEDVASAANVAVAEGRSAKDAAARVAAELGVSRRRAYDAVVAARGNPGRAREPGR